MEGFLGEEIQAIKNVISDYCSGCDDKKIELVMSLWTKNARVVWKEVGWDLRGIEEIRKAFSESFDAWNNTRHIHYNEKIMLNGKTADVLYYGDWHGDDAEGTTWLVEGRYERKMVKENGAWKIQHQEITQKPMRLMYPEEATQEIKNVIADYCKGFDNKDPELCFSVFADDAHAVWKEAGQDLHSKEQIKKAYAEGMNAWSNSRHKIYNIHINVTGNTAVSEHCIDWHADDQNGVTHALEGRYYREFVKTKGAWKIKYQKTIQDFMAPFQARPKV